MNDWIKKEAKRVQEERAKWLDEKGYGALLVLGKGENSIVIDVDKEPRITKTKYGERYVFALAYPEAQNFMCSPILYGQIVEKLAGQKDGRLKILRSGDGQDTKIELM